MQKVVLGRTALSATVMGLGGGGDSRLGRAGGENDGASVRLVRAALDHGINFIDTAEAYGTEAVIGEALSQVPRDSVIVSTKKRINGEDAVTPETLVRSLEESLRRLRTDYVDIYHLHGVWPEQYQGLRDRLVPTLHKLRDQKLVDEGLEFLLHPEGATSLPDAAYRFCRDEPGAHVILSGTGNVEHLIENVHSLARPLLPTRDRERLIELFRGVDDVSGH